MSGRVALVTGAARGQGRAHVTRLAEAGADIIAIDICDEVSPTIPYGPASSEDLEATACAVKSLGRDVLARVVDIRDLSAVTEVVTDGSGGSVDSTWWWPTPGCSAGTGHGSCRRRSGTP